MITTLDTHDGKSWSESLAGAIKTVADLLAFVKVRAEDLPGLLGPDGASAECVGFSPLVTCEFARRIRPGDPDDPLLRQVLPTCQESVQVQGYVLDPVRDQDAVVAPGVVQKYRGRVLWMTSAQCALHCRYCFRRNFPYADAGVGHDDAAAMAYIRAAEDVEEVILSGGDPLLTADRTLRTRIETLAAMPHVRRVRVHTRVPVALPSRVTHAMASILATTRLHTVVVVQINHANEIDGTVATAMARLRSVGVVLLNQAVLLRGVNDSVRALRDLGDALVGIGVVPYYLHLLDRVQGAAQFEVSEADGRALMNDLAAVVAGYMVPRLVRDEPLRAAKRVVDLSSM